VLKLELFAKEQGTVLFMGHGLKDMLLAKALKNVAGVSRRR